MALRLYTWAGLKGKQEAGGFRVEVPVRGVAWRRWRAGGNQVVERRRAAEQVRKGGGIRM